MTLDVRARATALRLLTKFGKSCTLKKVVPGVYDPATGSVTPVVTPYPVKAYLDAPNRTELAGGQVVATDSVAIFAALGLSVEPGINDLVEVDGRDRTVKFVTATWSGAQVALWRVGLSS